MRYPQSSQKFGLIFNHRSIGDVFIMKRNIVLTAKRLHTLAGFEFNAASWPAHTISFKFSQLSKAAGEMNRP